MRHIGTSLDVDAPAERVWALLADLHQWTGWGVSIRRVESEVRRVAPGATGRVQTVAGFWLPLRICDVIPGEFWIWDVAGVGATGHRVAPLADGRCRVEFTVPWMAAPYLTVLRISLQRLKTLAEEP